MPFLEIFLPSGHRNKVEVNSNSTLISVLEEICIKRNFNIDHCTLLHNKVRLDLSLKFGMTKLINNSKLELLVSPVSFLDNVNLDITLQLPNNKRISDTFSPHNSLWSILQKYAKSSTEYESLIFPQNSNLTPVLYHFHEQIIGEYCLQNTSLSSLGFRFGKALFRLELKEVTQDEIQNCVLKLQKKLKLNIHGIDQNIKETSSLDFPEFSSEVLPQNSSQLPQNIAMITQHAHPSGYVPFSVFPSNVELFNESVEKPSKQSQNQQKSVTLGDLIGVSLEKDSFWTPPTSANDFEHFKFPDDTAGQNLWINNETENITQLISNEKRESVFYHREQLMKLDSEEDAEIPDSFFEITENDIREIIKGYRQSAESDSPLMTKALREQMREAQLSKYERCIIQFHFQDAYILQSVFMTKETIGDLYGYVKYYLKNVTQDFHLYTTPPKKILSDKKLTLIKSNLMPMAKVYVSMKAREICVGKFDSLVPLGDETKAMELVKKWMHPKQTETVTMTQVSSENVPSTSQTTGYRIQPSTGHTSNSGKVPKWFNR